MTTRGALTVDAAEVCYGQTQALFGICMEVRPATVLAVLGANGAGKSTLGRVLSGLVPLKKGRRGVFPGLSVLDNLKMAARQLDGRGPRQAAIDRAFEMLLIEQFVHRALGLADECIILNRGMISWRGPAAVAGEEVLAQYLGEAARLVPGTGDAGGSGYPPTAGIRPGEEGT
jgi:ABC-type branched-subunit amino acid transport system ATPase component